MVVDGCDGYWFRTNRTDQHFASADGFREIVELYFQHTEHNTSKHNTTELTICAR